jgi:hypothetical protein
MDPNWAHHFELKHTVALLAWNRQFVWTVASL